MGSMSDACVCLKAWLHSEELAFVGREAAFRHSCFTDYLYRVLMNRVCTIIDFCGLYDSNRKRCSADPEAAPSHVKRAWRR